MDASSVGSTRIMKRGRIGLCRRSAIALLIGLCGSFVLGFGVVGGLERRQEHALLKDRAAAVGAIVEEQSYGWLMFDAVARASRDGDAAFTRAATSWGAQGSSVLLIRRHGSDWFVRSAAAAGESRPFQSGVLSLRQGQQLTGPLLGVVQDAKGDGASTVLLGPQGQRFLACALGAPYTATGFAVVSISLLPPENISRDPRFSDVDVALYVGTRVSPDKLLFTTASTPMEGDVIDVPTRMIGPMLARVSAYKPLDGTIAHDSGAIVSVIGVLLTIAAVGMVEVRTRRRSYAARLVEESTLQLRETLTAIEQAHVTDHGPAETRSSGAPPGLPLPEVAMSVASRRRLRLSRPALIALIVSTTLVALVALVGVRDIERSQQRRLLASRVTEIQDFTESWMENDRSLVTAVATASRLGRTNLAEAAPLAQIEGRLVLLLKKQGSGWIVESATKPGHQSDRIEGALKAAVDMAIGKPTTFVIPSLNGVRTMVYETGPPIAAPDHVVIMEMPAEQVLQYKVSQTSPTNDFNFAIYDGNRADPATLLVTNAPSTPLTGNILSTQMPGPDGMWLIQIGARAQLDGAVAHNASLIAFGAGLIMTILVVGLVETLVRRRNFALHVAEERTTQLRSSLTALEQARHELAHLANHDPLTGLRNRRGFAVELERQAALAQRYGPGGVLLTFDLDHFKTVNDTLGHNTGDEVIAHVAHLIATHLRETDVVARLGGDEFAAILPQDDAATGVYVGQKIVRTIREAMQSSPWGELPVTASVGLAEFTADLTGDQILANADLAMYKAKQSGRNQIATHHTAYSTTHRRAPDAHPTRRPATDPAWGKT